MLLDRLAGALLHLLAHGSTATDAVGSCERHVNPTMARLLVSVASCTFPAGLKPRLGIFMRRASGSVVLPRGAAGVSSLRACRCRPGARLQPASAAAQAAAPRPAPGAPASAAPPCCGPPSAAHSTPTTRRHRPAGATVGHAPGPAPATPAHALHAGSGSLRH
jgi:hypothetical protein